MLYTRIVLTTTLIVIACSSMAYSQNDRASAFTGQDMHLTAPVMTVCSDPSLDNKNHILIFDEGFSVLVGDNKLSSTSAVVWLEVEGGEYLGVPRLYYNVQIYLQGQVSIEQGKGARTTGLNQLVVERGEALVANFIVNGEIFATSDIQAYATLYEVNESDIYRNALAAAANVITEPEIASEAMVPDFDEMMKGIVEKEAKPGFGSSRRQELPKQAEVLPVEAPAEEPAYEYPVNISDLWGSNPVMEETETEDGKIATIIGRFYLSQKQDEKGGLLELQADSAVVFYSSEELDVEGQQDSSNLMASGSIDSIYLRGNVVMTEGIRTIRCEEMYYDFKKRRALAINSEMRDFDSKRGIPVYVRAAKIRQVTENVFNAENVTLTTSEFYLPQMSVNATKMLLTDTTGIDARTGKPVKDSSYDALLEDVKVKYYDTTLMTWGKMRTDFERPDIPLKSVRVGHDSDFGTSVETRWHLARLLGRKEPEDVDSTLALDYFGDRGVGAGADIKYRKQDYYGDIRGYVLRDRGEDDLGRVSSRKNLDSGQDLRGRFRFRHRHYLPYDWQLSVETSYTSDENFLEWFYRSEYNVGKAQETLVHLKRISDNWGVSMLNKFRITNHRTVTEELPTVEFHMKGASFFDHILTYYTDTRISRLRNRYSNLTTTARPQQFYNFSYTRHEVDLPFMWGTVKMVPFVAGTFAFEDQDGFDQKINDITAKSDDSVWLGETGVRLSTIFWKEDQFIRSRLWDINGIRHIIKPHIEAVSYYDSDSVIAMRDTVNFGISQRWQTRRGPENNLRSLDWMRLDLDATFVNDSAKHATDEIATGSADYGPADFIFNDPTIPMETRRNTSYYGLVRDSINADYAWRVTDTTLVLSDLNYDIDSGVIQQFDVGVSRYVHPDISYYLGNRYLRPVIVSLPTDGIYERGSSSLVAAATVALNPRYTIAVSQEYNFDYGKNIRTEVTILRRYHRLYCGLTIASDESLDRKTIVFSIWPQGVKELAFGRRKYFGISDPIYEE